MNDRLDRLSPTDMSSLLAERGPIHVHVGGTVILKGDPPSFEDLLGRVESRLHLVPRFRQKVTEVPLGLSNPVWADDPDFDLRWHVRRAALPRPGSREQLRELVGEVMSQPLDFARPLWQLYVVEGLDGKRRKHAFVSKTHHALVDGVSAVDVATILVDPTPDGGEIPLPDSPWEPDEPSPAMLFVRSASEQVRQPLGIARRAARSVAAPRETATGVLRTAEAFVGLATDAPTCPESPLNVTIGRDRRVGFVAAELAAIKAARGETGATVNDVILATVAGGLRHFLLHRGDPVPEHLVALVPVSIRRPDEKLELGNRLSTILVRIPISEPDPRRRLERIRAETARLKESEQARAASLIIRATGWAPPTINRALAAAMARPRTWNLVISNVPGPQQTFYMLGRQVLEIYPFVPLSPQGHALSVGVLSYDGGVFFGLVGDRKQLADIDELVHSLQEAIGEQTGSRPRPAGNRSA